ncbi:hypothetical protein K439DRAFT_1364707, partial [Ramaria rubella]
GCCDPEHSGTNYYHPLTALEGAIQLNFSPAQDWDPRNLLLHTNLGYQNTICYIQDGAMQGEWEYCAKTQGINGESVLVNLPGSSHVHSVPHKWMHLFLENLVPMMVDLWTG